MWRAIFIVLMISGAVRYMYDRPHYNPAPKRAVPVWVCQTDGGILAATKQWDGTYTVVCNGGEVLTAPRR